jgi:hypothetical protein
MVLRQPCRAGKTKYSRHYGLKRLGYDLERLEQRVVEIYRIDKKTSLKRTTEDTIRSEEPAVLLGSS